MRIAFFADIHGNLPALEAALEDARERGVTHMICLGDIVGYGPQPIECLERVRKVASGTVIGNHDAAVCGLFDRELFNDFARETSERVSLILSDEDRAWLKELPYQIEGDGFICTHGSFLNPEEFIYLSTKEEAIFNFKLYPEYPIMIVGHTHISCVFARVEGEKEPRKLPPEDFTIEEGTRYILNPGSIGFPRGEGITADYLIYDTVMQRVTFHRVPYDLAPYRLALVNNGYNLLNYWFLSPQASQRRVELALRAMRPRKIDLDDLPDFLPPRPSSSKLFMRVILVLTILIFSLVGLVIGMMISSDDREINQLAPVQTEQNQEAVFTLPHFDQWQIGFDGTVERFQNKIILTPTKNNQGYSIQSPEIDLVYNDYIYPFCAFSANMISSEKVGNNIGLIFKSEDGSMRKGRPRKYKKFTMRSFNEQVPQNVKKVSIKLTGTISKKLVIDNLLLKPLYKSK